MRSGQFCSVDIRVGAAMLGSTGGAYWNTEYGIRGVKAVQISTLFLADQISAGKDPEILKCGEESGKYSSSKSR
jgi:hypothetical protein